MQPSLVFFLKKSIIIILIITSIDEIFPKQTSGPRSLFNESLIRENLMINESWFPSGTSSPNVPVCGGSRTLNSSLSDDIQIEVQSRLNGNENALTILRSLKGYPSDRVFNWIHELRRLAETEVLKARTGGVVSCRIMSFTVGFYLNVVPQGKTLPQYVPKDASNNCGVAFVNEAFFPTGSNALGWIIVIVKTKPDELPFKSESISNDLQRAAHILKAAAPLLFPCTDLIIYGDTKCSYTAETNERRFPNFQFSEIWNLNKASQLYVLKHPADFGHPLKNEFDGTVQHMRTRGEIEPTFRDIETFLGLTSSIVYVSVPLLDAVCIAYPSEKYKFGKLGRSFTVLWMAMIEHFSMREQLSFNIAADLAFASTPNDFFRFRNFNEANAINAYEDKGIMYFPIPYVLH
jgi:hypothetical protein